MTPQELAWRTPLVLCPHCDKHTNPRKDLMFGKPVYRCEYCKWKIQIPQHICRCGLSWTGKLCPTCEEVLK